MQRTGLLGVTGAAGLALLSIVACSDEGEHPYELTATVQSRFAQGGGLGCAAIGNAITSTTGNVYSNAASLVDSYQSSVGAYGGSNIGAGANVQAVASIVARGGVINGTELVNAPSSLALVPVPAGAVKLPRGSTTPGNVNLNTASDILTLAPGNYVVASLNVNSPASIKISPPGPVSIWVTGNLNLGGSENKNGVPGNLTFFVTSSGSTNVNSGGQLYGTIYAPTSAVNLNSAVFGAVVGSSVTLNSGAAVHYDQSIISCPPPPPVTASPPRQLPAPPNVQGCYVGTWNGWVSVPCTPFNQLPPAQQQIPYIAGGEGVITGYLNGGVDEYGHMPGVATTDPGGLKFGQVDATVVNIAPSTTNQPAEFDDCFNTEPGFCGTAGTTPNTFSVQLNTNPFPATMGPSVFPAGPADAPGWVPGDPGWVQFVLQSYGASSNEFRVCIWQNDFKQGKKFTTASNHAYISNCVAASNSQFFHAQARDLQSLDNASVAGSAFIDANGTDHDLGIVAQLSWWDPAQATSDYRGLYATVAPDLYGLWQNGNWTTVSGSLLGYGSGSIARFKNASVLTKVMAGNCAKSVELPGQGQAGTSCTSNLPTTAGMESVLQYTDESNDLNIVPGTQSTNLTLTADGNNNLELQYLAATGSPAPCDATPHVFVKDYDQDTGSTPSNLGGQAFWESPDIVLVAPGGAATDPSLTQVVGGQTYWIWVKVHNDYGCAPVPGVTARVLVGDASLASPMWTDVITSSDNFFASPVPVPAFGSNVIGPIIWNAAATADPHQCLLAVIKSPQELAPANMTDTPSSNQVAQRNIEIGGSCDWTLTNGTQSSQLGVVFTATDAQHQSYLLKTGDTATITFDDPTQALFNGWSANPHPGCTLSPANQNTQTVVTMTTGVGQAIVQGATLASGTSLKVTSAVVPALFSGQTINVGIASYFSNGGAITNPVNGSTCSGTAENGQPPPR